MAKQASARPNTGGFFSLFGLPPTVFSVDVLEKLSGAMATAQRAGSTENESGYVYLGQFIAHDVTKLKTPNRESAPPSELVQLHEPALDLDSVYGSGFGDPRVAIDRKSGKMLLGRVAGANGKGSEDDLPRKNKKVAHIPDDRNDSNLLVAQLHVQFLKLHNIFIEGRRQKRPDWDTEALFNEARRQVILHYQQVVLYDYLHATLDSRTWEYVIGADRGSLWNPVRGEAARMPVEFSAAAFRFGHSMVRSRYTINERQQVRLDEVFSMTGRALPDTHIVDWSFFFNSDAQEKSPLFNNSLPLDPTIPLKDNRGPLAIRDLMTGNRSLLPDAQTLIRHIQSTHPDVARAVDLRPLTPEELNPDVESAQGAARKTSGLLDMLGDDYGLETKTPLWYYILAEALAVHEGTRLGPLGSLIVAEVLRALVRLSKPSALHEQFVSSYIEPTKDIHGRRYLRMTDLLNFVTQEGLH